MPSMLKLRTRTCLALALVCALAVARPSLAQEAPSEIAPDLEATPERAPGMTADQARAIVAAAIPDDGPAAARIDAALRLRAAGSVLGDQSAAIRALEVLVAAGDGRPEWPTWLLDAMNTHFSFGSQQRSMELGEKLLALPSLDPLLRARTTGNLAWKYCEINDNRNCERVYAMTERAIAELPAGVSDGQRKRLRVVLLQARAQVMRGRGEVDARVAALREATIVAREYQDSLAPRGNDDARSAQYRGALVTANYTAGQLVYALVSQGRASEALTVARDGLGRAKLAELGPDTIGAWNHRLASALLAQRRYEEALEASRTSIAELRRAGGQSNGLMMALARNAEVIALINLQRWSEADETYTAFLAEIRTDRVAYERSYSSVLSTILAAKNNRVEAAQQQIEGSYKYRQRMYGAKHPYTMEARGIRGAVLLIGNSPTLALADYGDLFTALLDSSNGWFDLAPVGLRGQYQNIALSEFLHYAARQYQSGGSAAIDGLFDRLVQVTDRLGTGTAQRAILESSAKVRSGDPALAALLGREQEQRGKLRDAFAQVIATATAGDVKDLAPEKRKQLRDELKVQREAADAVQKDLDGIRRELATKFPGFLALVNPVNPNGDAIRKSLGPGETFVGLYPTREGTFAWAINANGKRTMHVSRWTDADVAKRVAAVRASLDVGDRLPNLPPPDYAAGLELYNELLRPLRAALEGATFLDISATGALGGLPFGAVPTGPGQDPKSAPWLAREFAISQTPGAAAFVTLRQAEAKTVAPRPFLGFGDPRFTAAATTPRPSRVRNLVVTANAQQASTYTLETGFRYANIPPLPETREELTALAQALGGDATQDVVVGAAATRKAVMTMPLADRRVVAFATHGLLPDEIPGQSKPALAMAASDDPADSPLLTLDDVLTLKLNSQWVVLSACNTAGAERDGTAMSGLVRGFFFAGTRSVLATHWAVESEASRQLVSAVFGDFARDTKANRARSVQRVQIAMMDGTVGGGAYSHPFYWAPYALFGDPVH